jgi:hypothetical protein
MNVSRILHKFDSMNQFSLVRHNSQFLGCLSTKIKKSKYGDGIVRVYRSVSSLMSGDLEFDLTVSTEID